MAKVKVNFAIETDLLNDLDEYCEQNYTNRSSVICQSVLEKVNQQKLINSMVNASYAVRKAAEAGTLDDETKKTLAEFDAIASLLTKSYT